MPRAVHLMPRTRGVVQDAIDDADDAAPGKPVRHQFEADPTKVLHPSMLPGTAVQLLTVGRPRAALGSGDARPVLPRAGSEVFRQLPSRMGNTLRWPDGRVTDLSGTPRPITVNIADPDQGTVESMSLFERFAIGIPVFHGDPVAWSLIARLKYRNNGGKLSFSFELVRPDRVHQGAAKELIVKVSSGLGPVPLLMGECK